MPKARQLSKGERWLLATVSLFAALLLGLAYWHYSLEINPVISLPVPVLPNPNALQYYSKASKTLSDLQMMVGQPRCTYSLKELELFCGSNPDSWMDDSKLPIAAGQPAPTWEIAEAFVKRQAPAFAALHQGFNYNYYTIPHTSSLLFYNLVCVLALAGRVHAHQGDWSGATDYYLDAVQLGEETQHGHNFCDDSGNFFRM